MPRASATAGDASATSPASSPAYDRATHRAAVAPASPGRDPPRLDVPALVQADPLEQRPVVGDQDHGALEGVQRLLQLLDRGEVVREKVGKASAAFSAVRTW